MNVTFSIILPTFNRKEQVICAIRSVLSQMAADTELIIIDDGSADGTVDGISSLLVDGKVKLLINPINRGVNYSRNRGIAEAKGEYITFLDSDEYFLENSIEKIRSVVLLNRTLNGLSFKAVFDKTFKPCTYNCPKDGGKINFYDCISGRVSGDFVHVVKRWIFDDFKFFEEFRAEEYLNWLRIIKKFGPVVYFDIPVLAKKTSRDSLETSLILSNSWGIREKYKSNMKCVELYLSDFKEVDLKIAQYILKNTLILGLAIGEGKNCKYLFDELKKLSQQDYSQLKFIDLVKLGFILKFLIIIKGKIKKLRIAAKFFLKRRIQI